MFERPVYGRITGSTLSNSRDAVEAALHLLLQNDQSDIEAVQLLDEYGVVLRDELWLGRSHIRSKSTPIASQAADSFRSAA